MNKIIITIGGLLLLGTLTAAIINNVPQQELTAPVQDSPVANITQEVPLVGTTWIWDMTVDMNDDVVEPVDANDFKLTFLADGTLTSTTDCNTLGGEYTVDREVLSIGSLVATEKYCNEESLEQLYAEQLGLAGSYIIEDGALTLILAKDAGLMSFSSKK